MRSSFVSHRLTAAFVIAASLLPASARADGAPAPAPAAAAAPAPTPPPVAPAATPSPNEAPAPSEHHPSPNSIYIEGLGAGLDYSVNYERVFLDQLALRGGMSYLSFTPASPPGTVSAQVTYVTVPVTASYIGIRKGPSSLELGAGAVFIYTSAGASALGVSASGSGVLPGGVVMAGYRLHPLDHAGFQFRIGAMAIMGDAFGLQAAHPGAFGVIPWPYISFGVSL
jgi:hypothetical protein